ncbi:helix-turn-helix domain-containing protein [Candidatus Enterococcus mansonii]|uniref:Mga helix-turn-helix domain-containing protein n=1 Tax=Candidatus Enterococcus mansonii TaxID=1834181 RepID=A0A242C7P6_9ENTE|nr:helix-turn-helix domain-containing protein [Enterococcus sp. 4G2_DIV0659]OTO05812.1 hypothetical protein A5880_002987 [Enterococcus sp. 4G2_DIV0659]
MIEKLMLEDTARRKLTLFKLLTKLSESHHSIKFFETRTDYSYSRVVYLLDLIQQDLTKIIGKKVELIQVDGVHYKPTISYDMYYQYLIRQSIPCQLLVSIVYSPEDDLDAFCEKNFHSRTTVVRKSKPLSDYLKTFAIKMNTSQLKLYGDERVIRMTLYALIWLATHGAKLPQIKNPSMDYKEIIDIVSPYFPDSYSYAANKQITLFLDIVYLRAKTGYQLTEKTDIDPYIPAHTGYSNSFFKSIIQENKILEAETQFAAFLLISAPNFFRNNDYRLSLLKIYLESHVNPATKILEEVCTVFSDEFMPDRFLWENEPILFGNVANIIFTAAIIQKPFPSLFHLINHSLYAKNEYYYQLFKRFKTLFQKISKRKNCGWLKDSIHPLSDMLASLLVPIYASFQENNVLRVALIAESNYLLVQPLAQFIEQLPFVQLIAYEHDNFSSFDFIVATSAYLIPEESPLPSFIFRFSADNDEQYIDLYQAIKKIHNQKE